MSKQKSKAELWNEVPEELLKQVIGGWSQQDLLKITGVDVNGFRVGKIRPNLLVERVVKEYKKLPGVRENLQKAVEVNLEDIQQTLRKIRIRQFPEKLHELISNNCKTKVFLAAFLDDRRGMRKLAHDLWNNYSEPTEQENETVQDNKNTKNVPDNAETNHKNGKNEISIIAKMQKALNKSEKKIKDFREQHKKIVSDRDKKLLEQRYRLIELEKQIKAKEAETENLNNCLLEKKRQITKLEDALSSMSGQIRKLNQIREDDLLIIKELHDELEKLKETADKTELTIQPEVDNSEDADFVISVKGEFEYEGPNGWVKSEQGFINVPEDLVSKHHLITGDIIELKMGGKRDNSFEIIVAQKAQPRELAGFIVSEDGQYWVKCGTEMICVGIDEVLRVGASKGDPVSVLIPANNSDAKGRITKIHWVALVRDISSIPAKAKKNENTVKKPVAENTLSGIKVLVLGGDTVKNSYIRELQNKGAEVEWHTGFNELHAIPHKVSRADVVLVLTAHISHKAYYILKTAAKAYNKQPLYYNGLSIKGAAKAVAGFCPKHREIELIS